MTGHARAVEADRHAVPAPRSSRSSAPPATGLLRLQRLAGNRAVASLLVQREASAGGGEVTLAELGVPPEVAVDSARPEAVAADAPVQTVRQGDAAVQRTGDGTPTVQRVAHRCAAYDGYSSAFPLASYNCAGLAHRSYDYKSLAATNALLAGGGPASGGTEGQIKHWLWTYDVRLEDSAGRRTPPSADFHTVAGEIGAAGADPVDVYTKNGARPVYGPGAGPSFRPPARERATHNRSDEAPANDQAGGPLYKLRENMAERVVVLSCSSNQPPTQGPPAP